YMSVGEGTTSEGEFWETMNTACSRSLPVVILVEDNGYAISVPVEVQTPGGSISRLLESFPGLKVIRADGTDFIDSYKAMREAVERALKARKPPRKTASWYVYSPDVDPASSRFATSPAPTGKPDTIVAAINHTLKDEMARNPLIVVFGEDVADASRPDALEE